ncbi:hypothetical protein HNQ94_002753 [Salirhabdus euzebyi]|uniref:YceG-like family protein n=1 Tax=Salirhabdus euzebyi TaxID=394506 RepID=A0A841Q797_9BACI|nr:endolytic transglycosylase MltG [Salirhabdus euzebyi]MBB6454278.1 hypothetical protein [Salirhabdus euzebyi]
MKIVLRSFSIGLLTATILFGFTYYIEETERKKESSVEEENPLSIETASTFLQQEGFVVLTQDEWLSATEENEEQIVQEEPEEELSQEEEEAYILLIEPGMVIHEISTALYENGLIDDQVAFGKFLETNEYSTKIQIGEFELRKNMTHEEIAEVITK